MNVCGEDQPASAQTSYKGAPLARALEDATLLVEWALTPIGKAILFTSYQRVIASGIQCDMLLGDRITSFATTKAYQKLRGSTPLA